MLSTNHDLSPSNWVRSALNREKWWLAFNVLAVAIYLAMASTTWGEPDGFDLAITRGVTELPLFLIVAVADLVWFGRAAAKAATRPEGWRSMAPLLLVFAAWVGAYCFDWSQWGPPVS
jgi:hypothetical protein